MPSLAIAQDGPAPPANAQPLYTYHDRDLVAQTDDTRVVDGGNSTSWFDDLHRYIESLNLPVESDIIYGTMVGIILLLGILLTFKGKQYFKHLIAIVSFIVTVFTTLYFFIFCQNDANQNLLIFVPLCFLCGLVVSMLVFFLHKVALFATGVIGGGVFGRLLFNVIEPHVGEIQFIALHNEKVSIAVTVFFALIFGVLTLKMYNSALKILTPFLGSFMIVGSVAYYIQRATGETILLSLQTFFQQVRKANYSDVFNLSPYTLGSLIAWFVIFLIGVLVQCGKEEEEEEEDPVIKQIFYDANRKETAMYRDGDI